MWRLRPRRRSGQREVRPVNRVSVQPLVLQQPIPRAACVRRPSGPVQRAPLHHAVFRAPARACQPRRGPALRTRQPGRLRAARRNPHKHRNRERRPQKRHQRAHGRLRMRTSRLVLRKGPLLRPGPSRGPEHPRGLPPQRARAQARPAAVHGV